MKVYFVRHGESQFNVTRKHQHKDVPLTERGISQVTALAKRLKDHAIDKVISSRYVRASQTASVISDALHIPLEYSDFLFEVRVPSELAGKSTRDEGVLKINQQIIDNFAKENWKLSDEETFSDLKARSRTVLSQITANQCSAIVVVAHARIIRFLIAMIMFGVDLKPEHYMGLWCLELSNSGISVCDYLPENAKYNNHNPWRVVSINDVTRAD